MTWTRAQWSTAQRAYENAQLSAQHAATALRTIPDDLGTRIAVAAGPAGEAASQAAGQLMAQWPTARTAAAERTAVSLTRKVLTYVRRFRQVNARLFGGGLSLPDQQALDRTEWLEARSAQGQIDAVRVRALPGVVPEPGGLTSQPDASAEPQTVDAPQDIPSDDGEPPPLAELPQGEDVPRPARAPQAPTSTTRTRRRRRAARPSRVNFWPLAIAIGVWLFSRER